MQRIPLLAALVAVPSLMLLAAARPLNALLLGADYATNLGIRVKRVRTILLLLTGLLTAAVTALCGPISFIGLAVPHIVRLLMHTADHRRLLPATLVMGANVALLSLLLTHLPGERGTLPLSAITPFIGVPVVVYICCTGAVGECLIALDSHASGLKRQTLPLMGATRPAFGFSAASLLNMFANALKIFVERLLVFVVDDVQQVFQLVADFDT